MPAVTITAAPLTIEELLDIARGAPVELGADARTRIGASRAVVDAALASGRPVYGLNTGVGHLKDVRLPDEEVRRLQQTLVTTHAGGLGPPLPTELVRAAMAVRLNGLARGGAGASLDAADILVAMLNGGVHPVVPAIGSVGAGDLGQLACIALVATGMGRAEHSGEVLPGAEALARAGIQPLVLQPKDGLALMSASAISVGHAAVVLARAAEVAKAADVAIALSLEAIGGNPSVVLPVGGQAKPFPGQIAACRSIRAALAGSPLLEQDGPRSIQDPLSFRVAPQVHGALGEFIAFARRAVEIELNARSDNPLVDIDEQVMVHNGNFHPIVLGGDRRRGDATRTARRAVRVVAAISGGRRLQRAQAARRAGQPGRAAVGDRRARGPWHRRPVERRQSRRRRRRARRRTDGRAAAGARRPDGPGDQADAGQRDGRGLRGRRGGGGRGNRGPVPGAGPRGGSGEARPHRAVRGRAIAAVATEG